VNFSSTAQWVMHEENGGKGLRPLLGTYRRKHILLTVRVQVRVRVGFGFVLGLKLLAVVWLPGDDTDLPLVISSYILVDRRYTASTDLNEKKTSLTD